MPKNDHNSKNKNRKKSETWFFFIFSRLQFFHVNLTTFGEFFFLDFDVSWIHVSSWIFFKQNKKIYIYLQKWSNLHERSGIGWIERKTKFQIFRRQEILSNKTKKKNSRHTFYFNHYEVIDNCKNETCGIQYLQQKNHTWSKHCRQLYPYWFYYL